MLILVKSKATEQELKQASEDITDYIKVVVDLKKGILTAGGEMHVDGEKLLLKEGSNQENLWGGGLDLETKGIDFDSMINIRPDQGNPSRSVLLPGIREKMEKIIRNLLI